MDKISTTAPTHSLGNQQWPFGDGADGFLSARQAREIHLPQTPPLGGTCNPKRCQVAPLPVLGPVPPRPPQASTGSTTAAAPSMAARHRRVPAPPRRGRNGNDDAARGGGRARAAHVWGIVHWDGVLTGGPQRHKAIGRAQGPLVSGNSTAFNYWRVEGCRWGVAEGACRCVLMCFSLLNVYMVLSLCGGGDG